MGRRPFAEDVARRWADKYFFICSHEVFERARTLNLGTTAAECDLVLWKDNDLLVSPNFALNASAELRSRGLDYLIPYSRIDYLSEADSKCVIQGAKNPLDCAAIRSLKPVREACGAAGLVRKSFVARFGGMSEDFRGWGGEDDAWWFKARLLGLADVSKRQDQCLFHLHHPNFQADTETPARSHQILITRRIWRR